MNTARRHFFPAVHDFGVAASPATGLASINTAPCDHTDFATQASGPGIF